MSLSPESKGRSSVLPGLAASANILSVSRRTDSSDVAGDEDDPGAAVFTRPFLQHDRRVEDVLDAVNDNRSVEIDHIDDSLGPQKVRAPEQEQRFEPEIERIAMDRLIDREAHRLDVSVMAIDVVVLVGVAVASRSVFMIVRLGVGFGLEPVLHVEVLGLWVVKAGIEQQFRIDSTVSPHRSAEPRGSGPADGPASLRNTSSSTRSVLVTSRRSATAACLTDSIWRSSACRRH